MACETSEIRITNRNLITITGVESVVSFTEREAVLSTSLGVLAITGENFSVSGFDKNSGIVEISGKISAVFYPGQKKDTRGFFAKMFS